MRRFAAAAIVVASIAALIAIEVATSSSSRADLGPAPQLPSDVLVAPRVSIADLHGKPAAINFWASWCGPCRDEAPALQRLSRSLHGRARLIGVNYTDSLGGAQDFIREFHLTYPNLRDSDGVVGDRYGLTGLPGTAIINPRGRLVELLRGPQTTADVQHALDRASH
jgi:cytochrome c biogenesis protein CcmG/thiol:disulfide interchange protein DsbE